jgi:hypothetical protein
VEVGEYGKIESSLAEWAGRRLHTDAFAEVQLVRLFRDRSVKKK